MEGKEFINSLRGNGMKPQAPPVFKKRSESFKWFVLATVGVIILFAGAIWVSVASWMPPPQAQDYSNYHDYTKALKDWANNTRAGNFYGRIVMEVGSMTMVLAGMIAYMDPAVDFDEKKIFMVLALVGIIILVLVSVGIVETSPYTS